MEQTHPELQAKEDGGVSWFFFRNLLILVLLFWLNKEKLTVVGLTSGLTLQPYVGSLPITQLLAAV